MKLGPKTRETGDDTNAVEARIAAAEEQMKGYRGRSEGARAWLARETTEGMQTNSGAAATGAFSISGPSRTLATKPLDSLSVDRLGFGLSQNSR